MTQDAVLDALIRQFSRLPGLGARSARRAVLYLLKNKESLMPPLMQAMSDVYENVRPCEICGNLDTQSPCRLCCDAKRDSGTICVVRDVADLWALERSNAFRGKYHVLGGLLSALDGVTPQDLGIDRLERRLQTESVSELIFALPATMEGQTTVLYISEKLKDAGVKVSSLAQGIPLGAELDYLDDGTIQTALSGRRFY